MRVAVLGGGIAGLVSAHYLNKAGLRPVLIESADRLGGPAPSFEHDGIEFDALPHVILDSDSALCGLMAELGALGRVVWRRTGTALLQSGQQFPLTSAFDLLRLSALSPSSRLRAGLSTLYATRFQHFGLDLDRVPAVDWFVRLFGRESYELICRPYLESRFGEHAEQLPAYWLWERLKRERNDQIERMGYPRGGLAGLLDDLVRSIEQRGAEIRLGQDVTGVGPCSGGVEVEVDGRTEQFDAAVSTLNLPALRKIGQSALLREVSSIDLPYRSVVSTVVISRGELSPYFLTHVSDKEFPFQAIVETTQVIPGDWTGGRSLVYLMNYCDQASDAFREEDGRIGARALDALEGTFPGFSRANVEAVRTFRQTEIQPVWPLGYLERKPRPRLGDTRLYLCSEEQAYPRAAGWSTQVTVAREAVNAVKRDLC